LLVVGSGFIASELAQTASKRWGWGAHVLYRNYSNPRLSGLPSFVLPEQVSEIAGIISSIQPTDVVIALGSSYVPEINGDLDRALTQHLNGPMAVLDALSRLNDPISGKILVVGSASEYGTMGDGPTNEDHPARPRDHYGLIKLALRHVGLYYAQAHALPVIHVRQFNVTGPYQDRRFVIPSICGQIARMELNGTNKIVAGNTSVRRDFLAIADVCEAYKTLLLDGRPGMTVNVCSGDAWRIADIISAASRLRGIDVEIEVSDALLRENDKVQPLICGDPSLLKTLGWQPKVSMRAMLAEMLDFYAASPMQE
jgi:GDP-4-dehydro-6-deoxy-D-mannose reductase